MWSNGPRGGGADPDAGVADNKCTYLHNEMPRSSAEGLLTKYGKANGLFLVRRKGKAQFALSMVHNGRFRHYIIAVSRPIYTFDGGTGIFGEAITLDRMIQAMRSPRPNWADPLTLPITVQLAMTGRDQSGLIQWNLRGEQRLHDTYVEVLTPAGLDRKRSMPAPARASQPRSTKAPVRSASLASSSSAPRPSRSSRGGPSAMDHHVATLHGGTRGRTQTGGDHLRRALNADDDLYDFTRADGAGGALPAGPAIQPQLPRSSGGGGGISRSRRGTAGTSFVHKDMHKAKEEFQRSMAQRSAHHTMSMKVSPSSRGPPGGASSGGGGGGGGRGRPSSMDHVNALNRHRQSASMKLPPQAASSSAVGSTARRGGGGGGGGSVSYSPHGAQVYTTPQRGLVPTTPRSGPGSGEAGPALPYRRPSGGAAPPSGGDVLYDTTPGAFVGSRVITPVHHGGRNGSPANGGGGGRRPISPNYKPMEPDDRLGNPGGGGGNPMLPARGASLHTATPTYAEHTPSEPLYMDEAVSSPPVPMDSHPSQRAKDVGGVGGIPGADAALSPGESDGNPAPSKAKGSTKGRRSKIGGLFASIKGKKKGNSKSPAGRPVRPKLSERSFSQVSFLGAISVVGSTGGDICASAVERAKYNNATGSEPAVDGEMALFPTHISVTDRKNVELQYVPLRAVTYGFTDCDDAGIFAFVFEATPGNFCCLIVEAVGTVGSTLMKRMEVSMTVANIPIEYDGPDTMRTNSEANGVPI